MPAPELLEVARVARPHGVRGELKVIPHVEGSAPFAQATEVWLSAPGRPPTRLPLRRARAGHRQVLLTLEGLGSREAAEAWRGATVSVARAALPPLREGEYYLADLVGFEVVSPEGLVGTVVEVCVYPSVDAVVVRAPSGALREQILSEAWVEQVSFTERRLRLRSLDGLVE